MVVGTRLIVVETESVDVAGGKTGHPEVRPGEVK